jgi:hypothetical protein
MLGVQRCSPGPWCSVSISAQQLTTYALGNIAGTGNVVITPTVDGISISTTSGGGNVSAVGTPTYGQLAQWTGPTSIEGVNFETTGTGTLTYTSGCASGSIAPTFKYVIDGQTATITMTSAATCVLTGVSFVLGGLPSALQPVTTRYVSMIGQENSAIFPGFCSVTNSAVVTCGFFGMSSAASGFLIGSTLSYTVN